MLLKETIRTAVVSQRQELENFDFGIDREFLGRTKTLPKYAFIISGIRRCGKSTFMQQLRKGDHAFYYTNFEDPRLAGFALEDFETLEEVYLDEFGKNSNYYLDEIQAVDRWELFVRKIVDAGKKVVITGSNASLLSRELGTKLTGRHITNEIYPFSYSEFLQARKEKAGSKSFANYLEYGGFPEYLKNNRKETLRQLLNDIIERDIIVRHDVREKSALKILAVYLLSNSSKQISYNKITRTFGLGSVNTSRAFIAYLEDAYLFFTVKMFDYSLKKQVVNPKKVYAVDTGLINAVSINFTPDNGKMLENCVFMGLKRRGNEVYYFKGEKECDFLIKEGGEITEGIQACYELTEKNREREVGGLLEAMNKFKIKKGTVITMNQEDKIVAEGKSIMVIPAWKWILSK